MQVTAETLRVPLNRAKFQKCRNVNSLVTGLGLFMVLFAMLGGAYMLSCVFSEPKIRDFMISGVLMCAWLVVLMGSATIAAWQMAMTQTKALNQNLPALVIDQKGIVDNSSNYVFGRILWSEIESVELASVYAPNARKTFGGVALVLKNTNMLLAKKSKTVALWMQVDDEIKQKRRVFIPQGRIDMPIEEVVEQINAFRAKMT